MDHKQTKLKRRPKVGRSESKARMKLDKNMIQKTAANSLLSLMPAAISAMRRKLDSDLSYELVYAAANQTRQHFEGVSRASRVKPPTEMTVVVKHDPNLSQTEIRYSFTEAKFTIYTPEDLQAKVRSGDQKVSKEEALRNNLSESLPSTQLKLFYNQGLLLAQGDERAYRDRYLPKQFVHTKPLKKKSRRKAKPKATTTRRPLI